MVRFFAAKKDIFDGQIKLSAEDTAHIRSLRLRPSEYFVVCDGEGADYICKLGDRSGETVADIVETCLSFGEPSVKCSAYIAIAKGDRLDYAVQKSVELGVFEIFLFPSERCISNPGDITKKTARLQRIALETAKQCGRGIVPEVKALDAFKTAINQAAKADLPLFLYEDEKNLHLKKALEQCRMQNAECRNYTSISIVSGPEGGFEPHEAELARVEGMLAVTLGSRILRCETAPAAVLAVIMFHTGNF